MSITFVRKPEASALAHAAIPYAARRVPREAMLRLVRSGEAPRAGDLVLARVTRLGSHKHLELASGRKARLFPGDAIVLAYGHRYAPDQFEATVPSTLSPCHLAAAGGIAAQVLARHSRMASPTGIDPLGLIAGADGRALNLADFALHEKPMTTHRPFTVAVVGTSMNAGKTETATHVIRGLSNAGLRVGAAKVTGTGAGPDAWSMLDAGAFRVLDFVDAGLPSTFLAERDDLERVFRTLTAELAGAGAEAIVIEVADGIFQRETAMLVDSALFRARVDALLFASGDAGGATHGAQWLRSRDLPLRALSGLVSASPLASREAEGATGLPVLGLEDLALPYVARVLRVPEAPARIDKRVAA